MVAVSEIEGKPQPEFASQCVCSCMVNEIQLILNLLPVKSVNYVFGSSCTKHFNFSSSLSLPFPLVRVMEFN